MGLRWCDGAAVEGDLRDGRETRECLQRVGIEILDNIGISYQRDCLQVLQLVRKRRE